MLKVNKTSSSGYYRKILARLIPVNIGPPEPLDFYPLIPYIFSIIPRIKPGPKPYKNHAKHCNGMMQAVWHILE